MAGDEARERSGWWGRGSGGEAVEAGGLRGGAGVSERAEPESGDSSPSGLERRTHIQSVSKESVLSERVWYVIIAGLLP